MDRFERHIQDKLKNYEVDPPAELWDAIESQLPGENSKSLPWYRMAAAAALLLAIASISLVLLMRSGDTFSPPLAMEQIAPVSEDIRGMPMTPTSETTSTQTSWVSQANESTAYQQDLKTQPHTALTEKEVPEQPILAGTTLSEAVIQSLTSLPLESKPGVLNQTYTLAQLEAPVKTKARQTLTVDAAKSPTSAFGLSAYFAPQHSYRYQRQSAPRHSQSLESEIMSFATGVNVSYKINNRWKIQTGVGYNRIGQKINDVAVYAHPSMMPLYSNKGQTIERHPQSMSTSMGGIHFTNQRFYFADIGATRVNTLKSGYDSSIINLLNKAGSALVQHIDYIELPVVGQYKVLDRQVSVSLKAGVTTNYLAANSVYLYGGSQKEEIGKTVGINNFSWSGTGGLILAYPLGNHLHIQIEPTMNMFITPIGQVRNLTSKTYPYTYSVFMGFSYDL